MPTKETMGPLVWSFLDWAVLCQAIQKEFRFGGWGKFSTVEARAVAPLAEYQALHSVLSSCSLDVDVEAGGSEAQGHVLLFREFKASMSSLRPFLKERKQLKDRYLRMLLCPYPLPVPRLNPHIHSALHLLPVSFFNLHL